MLPSPHRKHCGKKCHQATAVFSAAQTPQGASTLRTAISVNQVGAGFLGGFSAPFTYQR